MKLTIVLHENCPPDAMQLIAQAIDYLSRPLGLPQDQTRYPITWWSQSESWGEVEIQVDYDAPQEYTVSFLRPAPFKSGAAP